MDKLISVIVPIYKVEKYLRKCLDSIINQTYKNLEIILVDDGSPDNCPQIVDEYAKNDKRIRVIHKENGGLSSARNAGLAIATGDYVAFADSDDILNVREYEILINLIKKYGVSISFCEHQKVYEDIDINISQTDELNKDKIEKTITIEEAIKEILLNENVGNYVWTKLFKKELFDGIEFPVGRTFEDVAILYKIIDKVDKIAYTNEKLYYYLFGRPGAITAKFSEKKVCDSFEYHYKQYKFFSDKYENAKIYLNVSFIKSYTSLMEKICINGYDNLFDDDEVIKAYDDFKKCMDEVDDETLNEYLEPYRIMSAVLLRRSRNIYKKMVKILYENLKNVPK